MDFELNEDQRARQKMLRDFVIREVIPTFHFWGKK